MYKKKIKILRIISTLNPKYGGPSNVIINLAIAQKRQGHHVCIASTYLSKLELNDIESLHIYLKNIGIELKLFKAISFYL